MSRGSALADTLVAAFVTALFLQGAVAAAHLQAAGERAQEAAAVAAAWAARYGDSAEAASLARALAPEAESVAVQPHRRGPRRHGPDTGPPGRARTGRWPPSSWAGSSSPSAPTGATVSDRGTVLPVLALLMVGGALAVALTVELGRCGAAWREASFAADAGAEAGAAHLDPGAVYSGRIRLDPAAAEEHRRATAALAVRPRVGRRADGRGHHHPGLRHGHPAVPAGPARPLRPRPPHRRVRLRHPGTGVAPGSRPRPAYTRPAWTPHRRLP